MATTAVVAVPILKGLTPMSWSNFGLLPSTERESKATGVNPLKYWFRSKNGQNTEGVFTALLAVDTPFFVQFIPFFVSKNV